MKNLIINIAAAALCVGCTENAQEKPQAKINMSDTNEINPYLLLMAHTIIRHVLEIDKNTSNGVISHTD